MKYYKKLEENKVLCELCPNYCIIRKNGISSCNARKNINGELISLTYNKPCAMNVDPVEKKPLYHFMPGTKTFSIGTAGCNLHCKNCQNHHISQNMSDEIFCREVSPKEIVQMAIKNNCRSISYTYNEPTVFYEYMLDIAKIARDNNIKNIIVSNGYINPEPLLEILPYIDAANIDLKSFNNSVYKSLFKAELNPVLNTIKEIYKHNVWIEITNLLIPEKTDDFKDIDAMCKWITENAGDEVPLHFSRFFPVYLMNEHYATPVETIKKACKIAKKNNIKFVYQGNVGEADSDTICYKCGTRLILRNFYSIYQINITNSSCDSCYQLIEGIWE